MTRSKRCSKGVIKEANQQRVDSYVLLYRRRVLMISDDVTLEDLMVRLRRLERSTRALQILLGCSIVGIFLLGSQASSNSRTVEARAYILRDESNRERVRISTEGKEAFVVLNDPAGNERARLSVTQDGPSLSLYDTSGKMRAHLVAIDRPALTLNDRAEKIRVQLEAEEAGPFITLYDPSESPSVLLGMNESGPILKLYSAKGKPSFSAP